MKFLMLEVPTNSANSASASLRSLVKNDAARCPAASISLACFCASSETLRTFSCDWATWLRKLELSSPSLMTSSSTIVAIAQSSRG